MICQIDQIINRLSPKFWKISLEKLYPMLVSWIRSRRIRFYMPSSERYCKRNGYILWGKYTRGRIIDIQCVTSEDGSQRYEKVEISGFGIQRIRDTETGATHAVLGEFLVPYKQYSLRYILFHLRQFFSKHVAQETYCGDNDIELKTFSMWLKWLREHINILYGLGLTKCYSDNWQIMSQWIRQIAGNIFEWTYNSLKKLNLALFQKRKMPENTMYRKYERSG